MTMEDRNEMRGTLFEERQRSSEKSPIATGTLQISGLKLRIALWPNRVAGEGTKAAGKKYWPVSVEYLQGSKAVLAKVRPSDITVTDANATPGGAYADGMPNAAPGGEEVDF